MSYNSFIDKYNLDDLTGEELLATLEQTFAEGSTLPFAEVGGELRSTEEDVVALRNNNAEYVNVLTYIAHKTGELAQKIEVLSVGLNDEAIFDDIVLILDLYRKLTQIYMDIMTRKHV